MLASFLDKRLTDAEVQRTAALAALVVSISLILLKALGYVLTDSMSLLASLADSLSDVVASMGTYIGIRTALTPADEEHRYGHGKAEAMAAMGTAAFVLGSASFLIIESIKRLIDPVPMETTLAGALIMGFSMVLTFALVRYQSYAVRRTKSVALAADQTHYMADFASNGAVIASLLLTAWTGFQMIDIFFGLGIAVWLLWQVIPVGKSAINMLMDHELDQADRDKIEALAKAHPHITGVHDLRTRQAGSDIFIELHLELPPDMKLRLAHGVGEQVEQAIRHAFPNADVMIHFDPEGVDEHRRDHVIAGDKPAATGAE